MVLLGFQTQLAQKNLEGYLTSMAFKIFSTSTSTKPFKTLMVGHRGNATDGGNLVTLICFETGFQAMTTLTTSISFTILEKQLILTQKLMVITVVCANITRS